MPVDPAPTRQKLVDSATRLFAERGVAAVALAEINRAAGQRNVSALQYHFGGRDELLAAILAPYATSIGRRRLELIAAAHRSDDGPGTERLRAAVEVLVRPLAEMVSGDWRDRAVLRIVADLYADPHRSYEEFDRLFGERATVEMTTVLLAALPAIPEEVRDERLRVASSCVVHACADGARLADVTEAADRSGAAAPTTPSLFVENLVDMIVGSLAAPVGAVTAAVASMDRPGLGIRR